MTKDINQKPLSSSAVMSLAEFRPLINEHLRQVFASAIKSAEPIDKAYVQLLELTSNQLLRGSKRLRPYLTYLAYLGCGGEASPAIFRAAASQELFHHFLLIHDDIIDRDLTRHGGLNVSGLYQKQFTEQGIGESDAIHYAASYAILAGDISCSLGYQAILDANFNPKLAIAAISRIQRMLLEVIGGQLMDVVSTLPYTGPISLEQLLKISRYKTAGYSFEAPLQTGAILANANLKIQRQLSQAAQPLGIGFQLTDDLLGVYGNESITGKSVLSDMREGKQTVLMYYAFELVKPTQSKTLRQLWGKRAAGAGDLATVQNLLNDCGAHAKVRDLAQDYLEQSITAIHASELNSHIKPHLVELAKFCINRDY